MATGHLFVVATPIGNLEDITARALNVLRTAHRIAAEDTRHSRRLLDHYGIRTPLTSYHEHNEIAKADSLLEEMLAGRDIALITDSGTPCVSDPGFRIVRSAHEHGIPVVSVPGPSAVTAALAASGLPTDTFAFHGFFPRKHGAAERLLDHLAKDGGTHIFFESPSRLVASLELLARAAPFAEACVARELSKIHEEITRGAPSELLRRYTGQAPRGECVLLVYFPKTRPYGDACSSEHLHELVEAAMANEGLSRRDAIRKVSADLGVPRNRVYAAAKEQP